MTDINSSCVVAAEINEFAVGTSKMVEINGLKILLVRLDDGFYAVSSICTHEEESLKEGILNGCEIECPRHGARFDIKTGENLTLPAVIPLRKYKVVIDGEKVKIDLAPDVKAL